MRKILLGIYISTLSLFSINIFAQSLTIEYVDTSNEADFGKKMHVCNSAFFMSGFHEVKNDLLCASKTANQGPQPPVSNWVDDTSTRRMGMHACPLGMAMIGIHVKDNVLKCATLPFQFISTNSEYVNYGTSYTNRYDMHACPLGWVMTGIHVKDNKFLCSMLTSY